MLWFYWLKCVVEGPEKLLEVWFAPSANTLAPSARPEGLKAVEAGVWEQMLDLVHCKILSVVKSDQVDAYLLSESSLFIFPHKLVLKTCGITTLLSGLPKMLEIAALAAGFPHTPADPEIGTLAAAATHRVFYSRKNFLYPDQQRGPHRSWRDEVRALDRIFRGGSAYMIGKMNGEHWYLYITEPENHLTSPLTPDYEKERPLQWNSAKTKSCSTPLTDQGEQDKEDETLEILMTDLDEGNARQFYLDHASATVEKQGLERAGHQAYGMLSTIHEEIPNGTCGHEYPDGHVDVFALANGDLEESMSGNERATCKHLPAELSTEGRALGSVVSNTCGLSDVYSTSQYPDARIDAYLFDPCGFSANGVIPAPAPQSKEASSEKHMVPASTSTHYFNVHVTPEPNCSYASFETNVPARQTGRETAEVVEQVVNIFRPGRFSVTIFEAKAQQGRAPGLESQKVSSRMEHIRGYRRVDRIVQDLDGYDLVFRHFERLDWKGGAPRLGENC